MGRTGVNKQRQRLRTLPRIASSPQPEEEAQKERKREGGSYYGGEEARPSGRAENLKKCDSEVWRG